MNNLKRICFCKSDSVGERKSPVEPAVGVTLNPLPCLLKAINPNILAQYGEI